MSGADPSASQEVSQNDIDAALAAAAVNSVDKGGAEIAVTSGAPGGGLADDPSTPDAAGTISSQTESQPGSGNPNAAPSTMSLDLPDFTPHPETEADSTIDLLRDVELNVKIELGRTEMLIEDVLRLGEGSVVELDKLAGDPVDVLVNDRLVARGEILVLNDNFCVRISEIIPHGTEAVPV